MSQDPNQTFLNNGLNFTSVVHSKSYPAITPKPTDLKDKIIFINGASKGVGRAVAISYAKTGASHIILAARSSLTTTTTAMIEAAKAANKPVPTIIPLTVDITSRSQVEASLQTLLHHPDFPRGSNAKIDVLINNAGYLKKFEPVAESDPEEWWREWEVNLNGTYLVTRTFLPLLLASTTKTIVNVSSIGALITLPGASGYQTSKLAILRFSEYLDLEYREKGLLVYSIHPGGIKTDLAVHMPAEFMEWLVDEPELPADSLVWLTRVRREWLGARYVSVNWDMEELEGRKGDIVKGDLLKVRLAVNLF